MLPPHIHGKRETCLPDDEDVIRRLPLLFIAIPLINGTISVRTRSMTTNFAGMLLLMLKGAAMGIANAIPGVSGGTIAFITGIYETLINAIKSFDLKALTLLKKLQFREFFAHTRFWFLLPLGIGVLSGLVGSSYALKQLFKTHELYRTVREVIDDHQSHLLS